MDVSHFIKTCPGSAGPDTVLVDYTLRGAALQVSRPVAEALSNGTLEGLELEAMARLGILVPDARTGQQRVGCPFFYTWYNLP